MLDGGLTYLLVLLLNVILKGAEFNFELFRRQWAINAELIAKLLSSIIVVILNYFISKGFVFKKKRETAKKTGAEAPEGTEPDAAAADGSSEPAEPEGPAESTEDSEPKE